MESSRDREPVEPSAPSSALDEIVFECLERIERDGAVALEELCAARPEFAEALRKRIEALKLSGLLALEPGGAEPPRSLIRPSELGRALAAERSRRQGGRENRS